MDIVNSNIRIRRNDEMYLSERVKDMKNDTVSIRRDLHKIPEAGFEEYKTSEYICKFLDGISAKYEKNVAETGVIVHFKGKNKEAIAFRADMDALSLSENSDIDFKSEHEGYMHGCGHDGHMTMLLMFAKYLSEVENQLDDSVVLIFQPAEEGPGGAKIIINDGILEKYNVKEIYGIHLHPDFEEGVLAINSGPVMAMTGEFDIDIHSKSGHGAMPHTAIDSIFIAANYINQMQSIVSRNIDPTKAAVVTIGKIQGGERRNIISEYTRLEGTVRAFSEEVFKVIKSRIYQLKESCELGYGCNIEIDYRELYPPVINDENCVDEFIKANKELEIVKFPPQMISEDFSYYLKEVPGAFIFLGTKNIDSNFVYPLHNSRFNFNESALLVGIQSYVNVLRYKGNNI